MLKTPKIVKVEKFIGLVTIEGQENPIEIERMTAYAGFPDNEFKTTFVALLDLPTKMGLHTLRSRLKRLPSKRPSKRLLTSLLLLTMKFRPKHKRLALSLLVILPKHSNSSKLDSIIVSYTIPFTSYNEQA